MSEDIVKLAERMYNNCQSIKPAWDQLGDVTRSVWIEKAKKAIEEASKSNTHSTRCNQRKGGEFNTLRCCYESGHSGECNWVVES